MFRSMSMLAGILLLVSCVTINIYFPAAAAEKAADRIIEDVWGKDAREPAPASEDESTGEQSARPATTPLAMRVLNWAVTPAQAQADININSPRINELKSKMKARHEELKPFYQQGAIGLNGKGLLEIRDADAVSLRDRSQLQNLVKAENADRQALYEEIARANGQPDWEADIQETFARRWQQNAPNGWWIEQDGNWQQK